MGQMLVRRLEDDVKEGLRARAKKNGHSLEEEVRVILREAVGKTVPPQEEGAGTRLAKIFAGKVPKEFKIVEMRGKVRFPKFDR